MIIKPGYWRENCRVDLKEGVHKIPQVFVVWQPFLVAEGSWMSTVQAVPALSAHTNHVAAL